MQEIDIATIREKAIRGIVALTGRTFLIQIIAFSATFLLTIFLSPAVFGIFYVVSACISFLSYFSDIGLAAALIQKKEILTDSDLQTTFTIQQTLVLFLCIIMFLLSSYIGAFYKLDESGIWLFRSLILSFFLSSLKTIPSVLLERKLEFNKLVFPQIVETVGFYGVSVVLAWQGFGITSFSYAVLVRAIAGLVVLYTIAPWKISIGLSLPIAKKLLRFGIPFQLNSILALAKDDLMTIFLGRILSFTEIGYIGWAKKWAEVPLRLIMDSVIRVTFPTFSRLQHDKAVLGKAIEKTLFGLAVTIIPISMGLLFFIEPAVSLIPKYGKWYPALFSFYLFVITSLVASFSTPLTNALNAIGKIKITLFLMVFWTIATWVLTLTFIPLVGFAGVALAQTVLSLSIFIVITLVKKVSPFSFMESIRIPVLASIVQGCTYFFLRGPKPYEPTRMVIVGAIGVILYIGIMWFFEKKKIASVAALFKRK
jgi:O-antigen/teichoic acid export membrane protein